MLCLIGSRELILRKGEEGMKRSVVLYIAVSLDGYIVRENGEIYWLHEVEGEGDSGYSEFY